MFGDLLPIHPQPLPDELLTSWLIRTAHHNGMKVQRLLDSAVGRNAATLNRDYDRSVPDAHLAAYARVTGVPIDRLRECTLRHLATRTLSTVVLKTSSPWILAAGVHHRKRKRHGLQYCPACLATDAQPYFRVGWRLAFYVICSSHQTQMLDACWKCGQPVVPHRVEQGRRSAIGGFSTRVCHHCFADLGHGPQLGPPTFDTAAEIALRCLTSCYWFRTSTIIGRDNEPTSDLLQDLRNIAHFVNSRRRVLKRLGPSVRALSKYPGSPRESCARFELENARLPERMEALCLAIWLVCRWPERLQFTLSNAPISRGRFLRAYDTWSDSMKTALGAPE